jgi:hypothetical protein
MWRAFSPSKGELQMKRIVLSVVTAFAAGLFFQHFLLTPHVLAQAPTQTHIVARGYPLANQKFVLVNEEQNSVGTLSFDGSGTPEIRLTGTYEAALQGHTRQVLLEIR